MDQGLVSLETVAQDGMRVRANVNPVLSQTSSFRRKPSLETLQKEAREHVEEPKRRKKAVSPKTQRETLALGNQYNGTSRHFRGVLTTDPARIKCPQHLSSLVQIE